MYFEFTPRNGNFFYVLPCFAFLDLVIAEFLKVDLKHVIRNVCIPYYQLMGTCPKSPEMWYSSIAPQLMGTF